MEVTGVSPTFEGKVWYRLNFNTGRASISFEEPPGGNWKKLERVRDVQFIAYKGRKRGSKAADFYSCTCQIDNEGILKPLLCTYIKEEWCWILFYPQFKEHFDVWWYSKLEDVKGIVAKEELCLWLLKSARYYFFNFIYFL